jgi:hypothetical protein
MGSMSDDIEAVKATTQEWMKTAGETGDVDRMLAAIELEDTVKGLQSAAVVAEQFPLPLVAEWFRLLPNTTAF